MSANGCKSLTRQWRTTMSAGGRLPWEEVRDWFHLAGNYVDTLDRAAEALADRLMGKANLAVAAESIELLFGRRAGDIAYLFRPTRECAIMMRRWRTNLIIDQSQPAESQRFQLAHQLVALALQDDISSVHPNVPRLA